VTAPAFSVGVSVWSELSAAAQKALLQRPTVRARADVAEAVRGVIATVRDEGDRAVRRYTAQFDGAVVNEARVTPAEFAEAEAALDSAQKQALEVAIANVTRFHAAQASAPLAVDVMPGVRCERVVRPIESVGLYVPAGSAPLPSAVIMLAVPARLAGCPRRVLCTPPGRNGRANAAVLVAAAMCGVDTVFKIGGAQAIAAMAYGTETVPSVDKVFGPGNAWVTAAKQLVAGDPDGAAFDSPAGPSEVLVLADETANPAFVAADLLAQAEHDKSSHAVLLTSSRTLADAVARAIEEQAARLSRQEILTTSVPAIRLVVVDDLVEAMALSNTYAPEHLLLQVREPRALLSQVTSAGSVFLGSYSPEPLGDYCSGTNHVLPTYGYARAYSGLSLHDFQKRITVQELTPSGLRSLGPTAVTLAELEGLDAHAAAVRVRLDAREEAS
jgi:histidinol dehydrogenase